MKTSSLDDVDAMHAISPHEIPVVILDITHDVIRAAYAIDHRSVPMVRSSKARAIANERERALFVRSLTSRQGVANEEVLEMVIRRALYDDVGVIRNGEGYVLCVERASASAGTREDATRMMFEEFNVAGLAFVDASAMAMYACGKLTGVSAEVTEDWSEVTCAVDGAAHAWTWRRAKRGGRVMDRAMRRAIEEKQGVDVGEDVARAIRVAHGKCAGSREEYEALTSGETAVEPETFVLPNGAELKLTSEVYACGEALMCDDFVFDEGEGGDGDHSGSLPTEICESVQKCALETRQLVLDNVFVHGEASRLPGLEARLLAELQSRLSLVPTMTTIPEYMPASTYEHAAWTGAAIASKVIFSSNQYITKTDYNENGPAFAHSKR